MSSYNNTIQNYLQKVRLMGLDVETINKSTQNEMYYIVHKSDQEAIILIPDETKTVGRILSNNRLDGSIKVIGGSGLTTAQAMFINQHQKVPNKLIDLTDFNTENVTDMSIMFAWCKVDEVRFKDINTHKVTEMWNMFSHSVIKKIDIKSLKTDNVKNMSGMFEYCEVPELELSNFNTSKVTDMSRMFRGCNIKSLDLSSFDTRKVSSMREMFEKSRAELIDCSNFKLRPDVDINKIFAEYFGKLTTGNKDLLYQYENGLWYG